MAFSSSTIGICVIALLPCLSAESHAIAEYGSELEQQIPLVFAERNIKRSDFPSNFLFGGATSALLTEGSPKEGGRGPSVYDVALEKFPDKFVDPSKFPVATDSYKRYKEDVKVLKAIGLNSYRFSISWSRILPKGTLSGGVNQEGIDHYSNLIDELLKNGIKPFVSLLHLDLPQGLEDKYKSFLSRSFIDDFKDYSEICFKNFGDTVKNWMTFNEPSSMAGSGYEFGIAPPFRCSYPAKQCMGGNSSTEPYVVSHNTILAHAAAVRLYREKYQHIHGPAEFGMVLEATYFKPNTSSVEDKAAAQRSMDFLIGWFAEPLIFGDYPKSMRDLVKERLPIISEKEKKMIKGTMDFIGINCYTSTYAANAPPTKQYRSHSVDSLSTTNSTRNGVPIGPLFPGSSFVYIYPQGLQKLLETLKKRYQNPKIYITENGVSDQPRNDSVPLAKQLHDPLRRYYVNRHLYCVINALKNGVDIKGYFYWSLHDSYEWGGGIGTRFGLYFVDYNDNLKRIPKESAKWFHDFLQSNATTSPAGSPSGSPKSSAIASPSGSPVGSPGPSGTGANAKSSAGSSIKLSISHLFFLICAATVVSTFTTY